MRKKIIKHLKLNDLSAYSYAFKILPNIALVSRQALPYAQCEGSFSGLPRGFLNHLSVHMLIFIYVFSDL